MLKINNHNQHDDDVVVNKDQHLLQQRAKTILEVSYPIYQKINSYISKKYPNSKYLGKQKAKEIDYIFSLGVEQAEKEFECPILFEEKKPRKDVLINLGKIANKFLQSPTYPDIRAVTLRQTINKVLGLKDDRTLKKYEKEQIKVNQGRKNDTKITLQPEYVHESI